MVTIDPGSITLGWREGVVALIVLVVLYMLIVLLRMRRLRAGRAAAAAVAAEPPVAAAPAVAIEESALAESDSAWQLAQARVAQEAFMRGVEDELMQLRDEVDALRGELAALREEMRHEVGHMRTQQAVSPIYNDAMQMAQLGHDPATIAERCGIARAEAELVVALVKSQGG